MSRSDRDSTLMDSSGDASEEQSNFVSRTFAHFNPKSKCSTERKRNSDIIDKTGTGPIKISRPLPSPKPPARTRMYGTIVQPLPLGTSLEMLDEPTSFPLDSVKKDPATCGNKRFSKYRSKVPSIVGRIADIFVNTDSSSKTSKLRKDDIELIEPTQSTRRKLQHITQKVRREPESNLENQGGNYPSDKEEKDQGLSWAESVQNLLESRLNESETSDKADTSPKTTSKEYEPPLKVNVPSENISGPLAVEEDMKNVPQNKEQDALEDVAKCDEGDIDGEQGEMESYYCIPPPPRPVTVEGETSIKADEVTCVQARKKQGPPVPMKNKAVLRAIQNSQE